MTIEVVVLTVGEGMAAGGDALARLADGRVVLVEGALPGETVEATIVSSRRDHAKARVTAVREAAPARVAPVCPHVAARPDGAGGLQQGCGGCGWAHVDPAAQPDLGERIVADALRRIGRLAGPPPFLPSRRIDPIGYRTTVAMTAAEGGRLAYHRRHTAGLVPVASCRVAHRRIAELIDTVRAPGWDAVSLRVGVAGGERLVVVERTPRASPRRRGQTRIAARPAVPRARVEAPTDTEVVYPDQDAVMHETVAGRTWRISARSFFQAGPAAAELLVDAVDAAVGGALGAGGHLLDAYAGVGLLGGVVAHRRQARLTAIEADPSGADDACVNLADVEATVVVSEVGRWAPEPVDVVIADPARPGLGRPGVQALAATGAARLVLVSCDPASLGRDAALLGAAGYRLAAVEVLGVFPDTVHIETVCQFSR